MSHTAPSNILVVDDTLENLRLLVELLADHGYKVRPASDGAFALESARLAPPDLILLDIKMPGMDGYDVCAQLKASELTRDIPVIFISALHEAVDKVKGFDLGGVDYITKPFQAEEVLARVRMHLLLYRLRHHLEDLVDERTTELHREIAEHKATTKQLQESLAEIQRLQAQLQAENIYLREEIQFEHNFEDIVGQSQVLKYLLFRTQQVAPTDTTVLIAGETGTGKELIARAIHHLSLRKERPLVKVNCAALPAHLIESELFGHEKGAFTGAMSKRIGRFELADGATIFLDEISELPLDLQAKLLRVLQEGEFERLGSSHTTKVDVRVIAATNRNLEQEVREGRFRLDLFYRLNVYPLSVPPLRERPEDIPLLMQALIQKFNKKLGKHIETIPQPTIHALQQYSWPGNVRELENLMERAMIITQDQTLRVELPATPMLSGGAHTTLAETERAHILHILEHSGWKINGADGAAARLGLHPSTLRSRMHKLGIKRRQSV